MTSLTRRILAPGVSFGVRPEDLSWEWDGWAPRARELDQLAELQEVVVPRPRAIGRRSTAISQTTLEDPVVPTDDAAQKDRRGRSPAARCYGVKKGGAAVNINGHHIDRGFFRGHMMLSVCVVAIVLVGIGLATGVGAFAVLGGAFCAAMMAMMVWMMVAGMRRHGH